MNPNQLKVKNRSERLELWKVAAGTLGSGLVSVGIASWLLDCSSTYVRRMVRDRVLDSRNVAGQRLVCLSSVVRYCEASSQSTK